MSHISAQELAKRLEEQPGLRLVDVRSPGEYAAGHVPGAMNIPLEQVESRIDDFGTAPVAILCHSGKRASMACEVLEQHRSDILVVDGGTQAWINSGLPVTEPAASRWSIERQVRLIAGIMILAGTILSVFAAASWVYLAMFVGAGLTFAGLTNQCGMASLLALMPWNKPQSCRAEAKKVTA